MLPVSLEQRRARRAYAVLTESPDLSEWTDRLPIMLQTNGLLATWAYLLSGHDDPSAGALLRTLCEHLWQFENGQGSAPAARTMFLTWVGEGTGHLTAQRMMHLTDEALALA